MLLRYFQLEFEFVIVYLQESFREKYNLAQYGVGGPLSAHKAPLLATGGVGAVGPSSGIAAHHHPHHHQVVPKNLPVPSLPHNLAARSVQTLARVVNAHLLSCRTQTTSCKISSKPKYTLCNGGGGGTFPPPPRDDPCKRFVTGGDVPPRDNP